MEYSGQNVEIKETRRNRGIKFWSSKNSLLRRAALSDHDGTVFALKPQDHTNDLKTHYGIKFIL